MFYYIEQAALVLIAILVFAGIGWIIKRKCFPND